MKRCPSCHSVEYAVVQTYRHFYLAACNKCSKLFVLSKYK